MPTFFNSIGSSGSETAAITKLMIVGGYLPPATKLALKRNGLYPSALLYLFMVELLRRLWDRLERRSSTMKR